MKHWEIRRRERLDGIEHLLVEADGKSVLDLGCNRGLVLYEFAVHGASKVLGVDKNAQAIATARHLFDDVTTCRWSFEHRDLIYGTPDETFDLVLMLGVYHKVRRVLNQRGMDVLVRAAVRGAEVFAWNGFEEEFVLINDAVKSEFPIHEHAQPWCVWRRR